jgi:RNA-binding protein
MKPVGEVVRAAQGLAVVRSPDAGHPDLGATAIDADLETVGRVVDVFGPVERPYVAVSPDGAANPAALVGTRLYVRTD